VLAITGALFAGGFACLVTPNSAGPPKHMQEVASVDVTPAADEAVIVFARPEGSAFEGQASVFEIEDEKPAVLIGILASMKKLAHRTTPGRHVFMAIGENADFINANLDGGKLYYVLVMPEGMGKKFSLQPVRAGEHEQIAPRLAQTSWVVTTPDSLAWARDNIDSIETKRTRHYGSWRRKPSFERLALFPDDGR
jgi:hypothetical protein